MCTREGTLGVCVDKSKANKATRGKVRDEMPVEPASNAGFTNCRKLLLEVNLDELSVDCTVQIIKIEMSAVLVPKGKVLDTSK